MKFDYSILFIVPILAVILNDNFSLWLNNIMMSTNPVIILVLFGCWLYLKFLQFGYVMMKKFVFKESP